MLNVVYSQGVKDPVASKYYNEDKVAAVSAENSGGGISDFTPANKGSAFLGQLSSIYYSNCFEKGIVELVDGTTLDPVMLRYDLYYQQFQFLKEDDTMAFARPEELSGVYLGTKKFIYSAYINRDFLDSSYFEVISDGKCRLLRRHYIKYHLAEKDPSVEKQYTYETRLFVKKGREPATPLRKCRKAVCCTFSDRKDEVNQFIKTNGLKMRKTEDLVRVIEFYNTLTTPR
jgi:hypothetical protein